MAPQGQANSKEVFTHVIGDMAKAVSERPGESASQQFIRTQVAVHMILGLRPRDVVELMVSGLGVMLHAVVTESIRDSLQGQASVTRYGARPGVVSLNKAFQMNIDRLARYQRRPLEEISAAEWGDDDEAARNEVARDDADVPAVDGDGGAPEAAISDVPDAMRADATDAAGGREHVSAEALVSDETTTRGAGSHSAPVTPAATVTPAKTQPSDRSPSMAGGNAQPLGQSPVMAGGKASYRPSPEAIAACRANPEAMAALAAGDAERFVLALSADPSKSGSLAVVPGLPVNAGQAGKSELAIPTGLASPTGLVSPKGNRSARRRLSRDRT
jgi:hypothetical protein